jgi:hypothetical protein
MRGSASRLKDGNSVKCPGLNCPNRAQVQIRLKYLKLVGLVCGPCAAALIQDGLAQEVEEKDRHGAGVPIQSHATSNDSAEMTGDRSLVRR